MSTQAPARENIAKLPDQCYVVLPANQQGERIGIVKVGESGYYQIHEPGMLFDADLQAVEDFVNEMNSYDGVTTAQRAAMEHGSMFGWEVPAADPDHEMNA